MFVFCVSLKLFPVHHSCRIDDGTDQQINGARCLLGRLISYPQVFKFKFLILSSFTYFLISCVVKRLPSWMPFSCSKEEVQKGRGMIEQLVYTPFNHVLKEMVSYSSLTSRLLYQLLIAKWNRSTLLCTRPSGYLGRRIFDHAVQA